jgi:hypothetical protein
MRLICAGLLILTVAAQPPGVDVPGTASVRDKGIADAVVWLDAPGAREGAIRQKAVLDQRDLSDYDALSASRSLSLHRFTAGGRVRLWSCLNGLVNVVHQPAGLAAGRSNVLDAGLTCTVRR